MTADEFDALFDRFAVSVFRLETFQQYRVGEDDEIAAWLQGEPKPERSVRTSPWLARIARTTIVDGKEWSRIHLVEEPLTDYLRYEFSAYVESQAAGEQIRIADRTSANLDFNEDFWLFDESRDDAYAIAMRYAEDGSMHGFELVTDPPTLARYTAMKGAAWGASVPLNDYLVRTAVTTGRA
ncbi:MAG TPA: hypothetical protein VHX59_25595 [Mycobacteriales bacterium]|jgi:hypothetical protein|nr:hypothetical protein [Mycobacteriales bacterium]